MNEDKSFTDILAKPGIALKLKALTLPSVRITYEGGQTYSLLPSNKGYFFASAKKEGEEEIVQSGLYGKLSASLNKIAEKLSSRSAALSYFSSSEKNKHTLSERSSIENNTIRQSDSLRSEKFILSQISQTKSDKGTVIEKTIFSKQSTAKDNSLASLSLKLNDLFRGQSGSKQTISSVNRGDVFVNNSKQNNSNLSMTDHSVFNKGKSSSSSNSLVTNTNLATISKFSSVQNQESMINLRDYAAGLSMLNGRREPITKSNFVGGNSDRTNVKPKAMQNYITQNFGDIIIQPTSLDVSVQQVKYKIEDVLRQVKDSLY